MAIFTVSILPIHEHARSFHLLRSSSISFFRDLKFLSYRSFTCLVRVTPRSLQPHRRSNNMNQPVPQSSQGLNHQPKSTQGGTQGFSRICSRGWPCGTSMRGEALGLVKARCPQCKGMPSSLLSKQNILIDANTFYRQ